MKSLLILLLLASVSFAQTNPYFDHLVIKRANEDSLGVQGLDPWASHYFEARVKPGGLVRQIIVIVEGGGGIAIRDSTGQVAGQSPNDNIWLSNYFIEDDSCDYTYQVRFDSIRVEADFPSPGTVVMIPVNLSFFPVDNDVACSAYSGKVFEDLNNNGLLDVGEPGMGMAQISVGGNNLRTNPNGDFYYSSVNSSETFTATAPKAYSVCSGGSASGATISYENTTVTTVTTGPSTNVRFGYKKPSQDCGNVCGQIWEDTDEDGVKDANERFLWGVNVQATPGNYITQTDASGNYCFVLPEGKQYTVHLVTRQKQQQCKNAWVIPTSSVTFPAQPPHTHSLDFRSGVLDSHSNDFGIKDAPVGNGVDVKIVRFSRWYNSSKTTICPSWDFKVVGEKQDFTLRLRMSEALDFKKFMNIPFASTVIGDTVYEWHFRKESIHFGYCFGVCFGIPAGIDSILFELEVVPGDNICSEDNYRKFTWNRNQGKTSAADNYLSTLAYSADLPLVIQQSDSVMTINTEFRNTGFTPIQHVRVEETLSQHLDIESINGTFSNRQYELDVEYTEPDSLPVLVFNMWNANIPTSSADDIGSRSFLQHEIKLKKNLPAGTEITTNTKVIFDGVEQTPMSVTNYIETQVGIADGTPAKNGLSIYPNPANDHLTIRSTKGMLGHIQLMDMTGRVVLSVNSNNTLENLNIAAVPAGIYLVRIGNTVAEKVVIR